MNWDLASEMVDFAFIRAGSINNVTGELYEDYQFQNNKEWAPDVLPIGWYWYFRPNHDPAAQADFFCDLIETEGWLLPPVADIEESGGMTPQAVADSLKEFLEEVEARFGIAPLIYTNPNIWENIVGKPSWGMQYPLWIAHWTSANEPSVPPPFPGWEFWQWTVAYDPGHTYGQESDRIDLDWVEDYTLDKYVNGAPPPNGELEARVLANELAIERLQTDLDEVEQWARNLQFEG